LRPVDPVADGVPEYPAVIAHPMDLGTVASRLRKGSYGSPQALREEVARVWRNSLLFNGVGHPVHDVAVRLALRFEDAFQRAVAAPHHLGEPAAAELAVGRAWLGRRVQVYWPDDFEFYPGIVDAARPSPAGEVRAARPRARAAARPVDTPSTRALP